MNVRDVLLCVVQVYYMWPLALAFMLLVFDLPGKNKGPPAAVAEAEAAEKRKVGYVHVSFVSRSGKGWCESEGEAREKLAKLRSSKLDKPLTSSTHAAILGLVLKNARQSPFGESDVVLVSGNRCRDIAQAVRKAVPAAEVKVVEKEANK